MQSILKKKAMAWHDENKEIYHRIADEIWAHPELGMNENLASQLLSDELAQNGFNVKRQIAEMPSAFVAEWGKGSPVIAFSAEYDALPSLSQEICTERKPVEERAAGHGCGHNILGAGAVKAAVGLKVIIAEAGLLGTIKVFGTPAEELCIGKPFMAAAGLFEGVDVFLDWHPKFFNRSCGEGCNAYFNVKYHFKGNSCHGNAPWNGRSAFDACMLQAQAVELMREHLPPGEPPEAANTINYVFAPDGMSYPNVIPDKATAWYIGRFTTTEELLDALKRVDRCAAAAAMATETEMEKEFITASHEKIINETISRLMLDNLEEIGAPHFTEEEQKFAREFQKKQGVAETGLDETILPYTKLGGALQDTSEYTWYAPYGLLRLTMAPANLGWHNWKITAFAGTSIAHKSMDQAAKILTASAISILEDSEILKKAKDEWNKKMAGRTYMRLIPEGVKPYKAFHDDLNV